MTTYKITGKTNGWIAQRDMKFRGKTEITLADGLTLKEAQGTLLDYFREEVDEYIPNWGLAVIGSARGRYGAAYAHPTHKDGTRSYEYDSRMYSIEEEEGGVICF